MTPLVSVLMASFNDEKYIKKAINSILSQTICDFEFIIIDDCSTDNTVNIIKSFTDSRITLYQNTENMGLGYNLHIGINIAKGKYIARMDADDISLPNRFEKQVAYLEAHQDVLCLGTSYRFIGDLGIRQKYLKNYIYQEENPEMLKAQCLIGTPLLHPSVMFNAKQMRRNNINYDPTFRKAQDYELWSRVIWGNLITNLPDALMFYRCSLQQASVAGRSSQIENSRKIYERMLTCILGRLPSEKELRAHILFSTQSCQSKQELELTLGWIKQLHIAVVKNKIIDRVALEKVLSKRWSVICRCSCSIFTKLPEYNNLGFPTSWNNYIRLFV